MFTSSNQVIKGGYPGQFGLLPSKYFINPEEILSPPELIPYISITFPFISLDPPSPSTAIPSIPNAFSGPVKVIVELVPLATPIPLSPGKLVENIINKLVATKTIFFKN